MATPAQQPTLSRRFRDRKSTRLNSSHLVISYAVFCLKKKNNRCHTVKLTIISVTGTELIRTNHKEWSINCRSHTPPLQSSRPVRSIQYQLQPHILNLA